MELKFFHPYHKEIVDIALFLLHNLCMKTIEPSNTTKTYPQMIRDRVISLHRRNFPALITAFMLLVSVPAVCRWVERYELAGEEGLAAKKRGKPVGNGRKLSPGQEENIKECLLNGESTKFGLNHSGWSGKAVSELIKQRFNIDAAARTVGDYLKRWNFTPQRPVKKAHEQDPEKVKQWFEYFEDIKRRVMSNGYQIYFADESGIRTEDHKTRSYAPKWQTPAIKSSGKRLKLNIISAISPSGLMKYMIYLESMTAKLFIKFMNNIIRNSTKKAFLVVDNLKVHHGKLVQAWLKDRSNKIELFFLPPYSPELNPDEYLNNIIKN
ncbi:MAG: IS630 family transposase, partial [Deltaproteobacteria bacterium]|nr:IS630 family transposase [Deltaproteobacteria bacterium]